MVFRDVVLTRGKNRMLAVLTVCDGRSCRWSLTYGRYMTGYIKIFKKKLPEFLKF